MKKSLGITLQFLCRSIEISGRRAGAHWFVVSCRVILICLVAGIPISRMPVYAQEQPSESEKGFHRPALAATTASGEKLKLYDGSHALLIGASRYQNWGALGSVPAELDELEGVLTEQGFLVQRLDDPTIDTLKSGVEEFISEHGYESENRLLIFFSGHGHSEGGKGFLVPVDAPLPEQRTAFRRHVLPMSQVMAWARDIESKHVLFVFDSCFSGSVFKSRNQPRAEERYIRRATQRPTRQFLTAGSAGELVPARSTFTPALVEAIQGEGDLNKDGYVTGNELGVHLSQEVPRYTDQSPQFGSIRDYDLGQGDFVFFPVIAHSADDHTAPQQAQNPGQSASIVVAELPSAELDRALWEAAKIDNSESSYQHYLERFPSGVFAGIAADRLRRLQRDREVLTSSVEQPSAGTNQVLEQVANDFIEPEMINVPGGIFTMGTRTPSLYGEIPSRQVSVAPFRLARYELTWGEWGLCEIAGACQVIDKPLQLAEKSTAEIFSHPVVNVRMAHVSEYINWINRQTGLTYRLPSESEWEYAARANSTSVYAWGDEIGSGNASCNGCNLGERFISSTPVGSFPANAFKLHDMHGNVWEWVADCWHDSYVGAPVDSSAWTDGCTSVDSKVVRGGSWLDDPEQLRSASRSEFDISNAILNVGFRLARSVP